MVVWFALLDAVRVYGEKQGLPLQMSCGHRACLKASRYEPGSWLVAALGQSWWQRVCRERTIQDRTSLMFCYIIDFLKLSVFTEKHVFSTRLSLAIRKVI